MSPLHCHRDDKALSPSHRRYSRMFASPLGRLFYQSLAALHPSAPRQACQSSSAVHAVGWGEETLSLRPKVLDRCRATCSWARPGTRGVAWSFSFTAPSSFSLAGVHQMRRRSPQASTAQQPTKVPPRSYHSRVHTYYELLPAPLEHHTHESGRHLTRANVDCHHWWRSTCGKPTLLIAVSSHFGGHPWPCTNASMLRLVSVVVELHLTPGSISGRESAS
ncbi:hypothetical protein CABS01_05356 [Colletotrichum abscissum]|uniref:uncharacterized protein n=1 Tax=Colletotrichum abscissum TaxID=1671311 RepID=UPI0027D4AD33|nr:uncharacterized protein CABS01_05356 [Colletotrichum abscissum]KAK1523735.1 hypothetical protein CABS01_05356 [Colletotrichum abscissum]